jgi:hypothetical protein
VKHRSLAVPPGTEAHSLSIDAVSDMCPICFEERPENKEFMYDDVNPLFNF